MEQAHAHIQEWARLIGLPSNASCTITSMPIAVHLGLSNYRRHFLAQFGTDCDAGIPNGWAADNGLAAVVLKPAHAQQCICQPI